MNIFKFFSLLREIFYKQDPDIDKIQSMGLLAVKIAQVFALRPDFLDDEKCRKLSVLYRKALPVPFEDLEKILVTPEEKNIFAQFSEFDTKPFAVASVGQVHKAKTKNGEVVAVKLIKKRASADFRKDVARVRLFFKLALWFYPKLKGVANPGELVGQIEKTTLAELDLRNEASGHKTLSEIYDRLETDYNIQTVGRVKVFYELSSENILTTEFLTGKTLDELLEKNELKYETLLEFFHVHCLALYKYGVFHGDIHPGNIIFQNDKFYFLDAGYIGKADKKLRDNLLLFFEQLCVYNFKEAPKFLHKMSTTVLPDNILEKYIIDFQKLYAGFEHKSVSQASLTKKMMQTIKMGVLYGMTFPEGMFDIIKTHMYLDGMAIRCNPDAKLLEDVVKFIDEFKNEKNG
jgi:ubiquinone biosynthesis protein